jgi:hypothetical protein
MKNPASKLTKRAGLIGLFLIGAILVNAQSTKNDPSWTVSKGVQKVANKKNFENDAKRNSQLQATSTDQQWIVAKGVNRANTTEPSSQGNLSSNGIPMWAISKEVNRAGMAESSSQGTVATKGNSASPASKGGHQHGNK